MCGEERGKGLYAAVDVTADQELLRGSPFAVQAHGDSRLRQARSDRLCDVETGGSVWVFDHAPVREANFD